MSGRTRWVHGHKWVPVVVGTVAAAIVAVVVVLLAGGGGSTKAKATVPKTSANPIVASYQKQLPALAAAVAKTPTNAGAIRAYGVALYATGETAQALTQYQAELKLNPKDAVLANNIGNAYRDLGSYDKARAAYDSSISLAPKSPTAYINLADLYTYTLKQPQLGITTIQSAQKNIPNSADLGVLLGIAYEQTHDTKDATAAFRAVLEIDSGNAAAIAGLKRLPA